MSEDTPSFFESHPMGNPQYRETQTEVLQSLNVDSVENVLPPRFRELAVTGTPRHDVYTYKENDGREILVSYEQNGTASIVEFQKTKIKKPLNPFEQYFARYPKLLSLYFIDNINRTAWDASQLWKKPSDVKVGKEMPLHEAAEQPAGEARVLLNQSESDGFFPDGVGGTILLGQLAVKDQRQSLLGITSHFSEKELQAIRRLVIPHEAAHRYQHHRFDGIDFSFKTVATLVGESFLWRIVKRFPSSVKVLSVMPSIKRHLEFTREKEVQQERNAHAFALQTIRYLKSQGLDLCRGMTNEEIVQGVQAALKSYENGFRYIAGKSFQSHKYRGKHREESKTTLDPQKKWKLEPVPTG